jgi:hypothetical protein
MFDFLNSLKHKTPARKDLIAQLQEVAKLPTPKLRELYAFAANSRDYAAPRINDYLAMVTRMAFEVETITEKKSGAGRMAMIDDCARPYDWLYPLEKQGSGFVFVGVPTDALNIMNAAMGYSALPEFEKVAALSKRRS